MPYSTLLLATLAAAGLIPGFAHCQSARSEYGVKFDSTPGAYLSRDAVSGSAIPINRAYSELTDSERSIVKGWYRNLRQDDEPPFPVAGLKPIYEALFKAQQRLLVTGELVLIATVDSKGEVIQVAAMGAPSQEMVEFASNVLFLTKFKPALCKGQPCQMDFPLNHLFRIQR